TQYVSDSPEDNRPNDGSQCCGRIDKRRLKRGQLPLVAQHADDDADDEQVVGVSKEAHARDEQDFEMEGRDALLIQLLEALRLRRNRWSGHTLRWGQGAFRVGRGRVNPS